MQLLLAAFVLLQAAPCSATDPATAAERTWKNDCTRGVESSCVQLARAALVREGIRALPRVEESLARACSASLGEACEVLGTWLPPERQGDVAAYFAAAATQYRRECDRGEGNGCERLARMVILGRTTGESAELLRARARHLLRAECERHRGEACLSLANIYKEDPSADAQQKAEGWFRSACSNGVPLACYSVGRSLLAKNPGDKETLRIVSRYFERACASGLGSACVARAGIAERVGSPASVIEWRTRGCSAGEGGACSQLARAYDEGDGVRPDPTKADRFREKACSVGDCEACLAAQKTRRE
jgi:TPR repeat protein